jgi:hypothetical protein
VSDIRRAVHRMLRTIRNLLLAVALVAIVLAIGAVVLYLLPAWLVPASPKLSLADRLHAASDWRNSMAQVATGAALLAGLYFTGRTLRLNALATRQQHDIQTRTLQLSERGQITDRFSRAVDQLGSDKLDGRLGGIFALERIAVDQLAGRNSALENAPPTTPRVET